jgi:hypothetical protein
MSHIAHPYLPSLMPSPSLTSLLPIPMPIPNSLSIAFTVPNPVPLSLSLSDVHHGNGTEETIRWLTPGLETSELVTPMGFGTLSAPRYKPWHDANDAGEGQGVCKGQGERLGVGETQYE